MVDRMVPWLPTSAMASFLNMGEKVRRNSVSKTEFILFQSRTDMAGNKYPQTPWMEMQMATRGGHVVSIIVVVYKHKHHYLIFTEYLLWCMRTRSHHENHCHILGKG